LYGFFESQMDAATGTWLLFFASVAAGVAAFRHALTLGDKAPTPLRWLLRISLGVLVFLAVWGEMAYALWSLGVSLNLGSIANGRIHEAWWFGPAGGVFAMIAYGLLREGTSSNRAWKFTKTIGGAVLIALGLLAVVFGVRLLIGPTHVPVSIHVQ